jgi:site-specific DNA recombinase
LAIATVVRPREEWIALPVPDPGIPREWVDAARVGIKDNHPPSSNGRRFWELSGRILYCGVCGRQMATAAVRGGGGRSKVYFYYRCHSRHNEGADACPQAKSFRAEAMETQVWEVVSGIFKDPKRLRADLERMIELEREDVRGDPDREAKAWLEKLAEIERKRSSFQDMAAEGLITFDELRAKLAGLEETQVTARHELEVLERRREHLESLERDKETLLENFAALAPEALDSLTPEQRHHLYKILRLRVEINLDGSLEVGGMLVDNTIVYQMEELSSWSL